MIHRHTGQLSCPCTMFVSVSESRISTFVQSRCLSTTNDGSQLEESNHIYDCEYGVATQLFCCI